MNILSIILIIAGVACFIYGLLIVLGIVKTDTSKDLESDKKVLSEKTRYQIGRYLGGTQGIIGGLGLILFGFILYFA